MNSWKSRSTCSQIIVKACHFSFIFRRTASTSQDLIILCNSLILRAMKFQRRDPITRMASITITPYCMCSKAKTRLQHLAKPDTASVISEVKPTLFLYIPKMFYQSLLFSLHNLAINWPQLIWHRSHHLTWSF